MRQWREAVRGAENKLPQGESGAVAKAAPGRSVSLRW